MSDSHDMDMVNERLYQINELLNSIKTQNALNIGDTSRALNNLSIKVDTLAGENEDKFIKTILEELKNTLEDRYSLINVKFAEIDATFKNIIAKNEEVLTEPKVKELFDVISTNISVFSKQVMSQGDILNEITLRIEALRTDDTQKREITKSFSMLKSDLERFNNGFESIVLNVNESSKSILEKISQLDTSADLQEVKTNTENLFLSVNALVSSTQIIDQKHNSLETAIKQIPNLDAINSQKELLNELISQNSKLNASVRALAGQSDFDALINKTEDALQVMAALKIDLTENSNQNKKFLLDTLENLEKTVSKILSEEDFDKFKTELSSLVVEVVQTTNVVRGDVLSTTSELKNLVAVMNSLDFKASFEQLQNFLSIVENNIKTSVSEVGGKIIQESEISVLRNVNELSNKVDLVNENVSNIPNYTAEKMSVNLNEIANKLLLLQEEVKQNNNVYSENFAQRYDQLTDKLSSLNMSLDSLSTLGLNSLKYNMDELVQKVEAANVALTEHSKTSYGELTERLKTISQSIELLESKAVKPTGNDGLEYILATISALAKQIESIKNNLNLDFSNNFAKIKELVTFMPDVIKENHISVEEEKRVFIERTANEIQELIDYVQEVKSYTQLDTAVRDGIVNDVKTVKELLLDLRHNINFNEEIAAKFSVLETVIARVAGDYDVSLYNVQNKLLEFLKIIKENCETTDIKLSNSIFEISGIQAELQKIFYDLKNIHEVQDEQYLEIFKSLMLKVDTILNCIATVNPEVMNGAVTATAQVDFSELENKIENILTLIKEDRAKIKTDISKRDTESDDELVRIEAKINQIKEQLSFNVTDLMENSNNKAQVILEQIQPVKDSMENFLSIDFQSIVNDIKVQTEYYSENFKRIFDEIQDEEQKGILENLFNGLAVLNSKMRTIEEDVTQKHANSLLEMKFIIEKVRDILEQNRHLDFDCSTLINDIGTKIDEKLVGLYENFDEKFNQMHDRFNQINGRFDEIHNKLDSFNELKNYQEQIITEVNNLKSVIKDGDFDSVSSIKVKIDEIQESLKTYSPSKTGMQDITEAQIKGLDDEEKSIVMLFSKNLTELVSIIQASTKELDEKITDLKNTGKNSCELDMSALKPELENILAKIDEKFNNISINPESIKWSLLEVSEKNKQEILNKIEKTEQNEQLSRTLESLGNKMDVLALNDGIKYNIEKSLSEVKDILETQQKIFKPLEILETLNTLNDIRKLKGIEQLSKLNDIISVEKLNALNKLNLLDKLGSIERLDDIQKLPQLSGMIDIQNKLGETFEELRKKLEFFENNYTDIGDFSSNVKTNLEQTKAEIKKYVLDLFNQVSFVVESEEIKDFVEEKTSSVLIELNKIKEKTADNDSEAIDIIKKQINIIKTGSEEATEDNIYSLQDLESDIAKLRFIINELHKNNNPEEFALISQNIGIIAQSLDNLKFDFTRQDLDKMKFDIEKLNADIMSISSRINKLLLKSDEAKISLDNTTRASSQATLPVDETKFKDIMNANKAINNNVYKLLEGLNELKTGMPTNENLILLMEEKFTLQQNKIDVLELKIEELINALNAQDTTQIIKKVSNIDKQLNKLNKSIEQLTSYVDEEE